MKQLLTLISLGALAASNASATVTLLYDASLDYHNSTGANPTDTYLATLDWFNDTTATERAIFIPYGQLSLGSGAAGPKVFTGGGISVDRNQTAIDPFARAILIRGSETVGSVDGKLQTDPLRFNSADSLYDIFSGVALMDTPSTLNAANISTLTLAIKPGGDYENSVTSFAIHWAVESNGQVYLASSPFSITDVGKDTTTYITLSSNFTDLDWASHTFDNTTASFNVSGLSFASETFTNGIDKIGVFVAWDENVDNANLLTFNFGQIGYSAVPEPSTYAAFFGLGALGFVLIRRRK